MPSITQMITPWMEKAIEDFGGGEPIWWETQMMPNPQNNNLPMVVVLVWMPGIALDHHIAGSFTIPDPPVQAVGENILATMEEFLNSMRAGRADLLAQQMPQEPEVGPQAPVAPPAAQNGHGPVPRGGQTASGLFLP